MQIRNYLEKLLPIYNLAKKRNVSLKNILEAYVRDQFPVFLYEKQKSNNFESYLKPTTEKYRTIFLERLTSRNVIFQLKGKG